MNIHHLELFYYVAKHGGIAAAVRQIPYGIQQPAISGQIAKLEDSLGVKLFTRRPFALSKAGEELFQFIEPFFANLDSVARKIRGSAAPHLRIAAPSVALHEYMPDLLRHVREQFPAFKLSLHEAGQPDAERLLLAGEIDLALAVLETKPRAGLESRVLLDIPLALVVPKGHPLTDPNELFQCDTVEETLISFVPNETVSTCFQRGLEKRGTEWRPGIEVNSTRLIECYVANGFGLGVTVAVPGRMTNPEVRYHLLHHFPHVTVGALWVGELTELAAHFLHEVEGEAARIG